MGKKISRAAAAAILGCSQQTVSNYSERGLLDVSVREQKGRRGFFYDEAQVRALAPNLRDVKELEEIIEKEKASLKGLTCNLPCPTTQRSCTT